ncbi:MAG: PspC domain-containing protein [Deltaproteobacteria bacterium]|nr:PspC domain-containing protein [Deltaproteobacteria bacterium]
MGRHHSHRRYARHDRLYRSQKGMILGVCRGLADYFNVSVSGIRITAVILFIFTGFWPIGALYLLAALVIKPRPRVMERPRYTEAHEEQYDPYAETRGATLSQLKRSSDRLNQRLQNMEDIVISREQDWDRRFKQAVNSSGM